MTPKTSFPGFELWVHRQCVMFCVRFISFDIMNARFIHVLAKSCSSLGFPDNSAGKEYACNAGDPSSMPGSGRSAGEGIGYPLQYSWASLVAQLVKNLSAYNAGDLGLIPELGRSPGEGKGYPLQYSGLENSLDCIDHEVAKSWTRLSDFHFFAAFTWVIITHLFIRYVD